MRIGIDLGGTKIEAIAIDTEGQERFRQRVATPRHDYEATLNALVALVEEAEQHIGQTASVGMGIPGAISPATGRVKNANSVWLNKQPLKQDIEARLNREVRIENDANCFAVSEASDGAGKDADVVFGVIVGTGTGGGLVIHGKPLTGINAIAGEWGHNPLPWPTKEELPGPPCYCGKHGCIETYLSGPGLSQDYFLHSNQKCDAKQILQLSQEGDALAEQAMQRYENRMARALASVVNVVDPDVIVLGGGMSNIQRLYENVPEILPQFVFSDRVDTRIVPPRHGDSSGVRGAAWLWK